ncbi:metal-dependent transcriptional regulator [Halanaerobacter jeridensis]|uniref:Mn-dependent DtxR family transcriptional regulator n=1 Tax=Halanaerobacter jeridensis TaxID=706427 RepID=A0A938XPN9_9FIRM|nr:iron dependent repressor, metal binding and dimerization domain protein [Halanaerobacter jeridensis]MBM7557323.1 Mn-dependent DtxR family transcriptional regulator [Halanaerobacter jeridensis]
MLSPSLEDYLEEIYRFASQQQVVRTTDIAQKLNVSLPSVTKAVKKLSQKGYLQYERYKNIELTSQGKHLGKFLVTRNRTLQEFLAVINSNCNKENEAEAMEHYLSDTTVEAITILVAFFKRYPQLQQKLLEFKNKKTSPLSKD